MSGWHSQYKPSYSPCREISSLGEDTGMRNRPTCPDDFSCCETQECFYQKSSGGTLSCTVLLPLSAAQKSSRVFAIGP